MSPAGLFLSAPYAESSFSFLNFVGFYLYALSLKAHHDSRSNLRDILIVVSGLAFGLATIFRSNGLLSGLLFCFDMVRAVVLFRKGLRLGELVSSLRRIMILVTGGLIMAAGSFYPQYLAYFEYCVDAEPTHQATWCTHRVPSIYAWVQSHYW